MSIEEDSYEKIRQQAPECKSEAEIASVVDGAIEQYIYLATGKWVLIKKEVSSYSERRTYPGRIDSMIGSVTGEYKKPGVLTSGKARDKTRKQLTGYLDDLDNSKELIGYMTDGEYCEIFRYRNGKVIAQEHVGGLDLSASTILFKHAQGSHFALNSDNLVKSMCNSSDNLAVKLARKLFNKLKEMSADEQVKKDIIGPWMALFRLSHDDKEVFQKDNKEMRKELSEFMAEKLITQVEAHLAIFCIQTVYAAIIKLTAYRTISHYQKGEGTLSLGELKSYELDNLYSKLRDIENGNDFPEFPNLFEKDTFSWYCDEKFIDEEIGNALKKIIGQLVCFLPEITENETQITDLFRDLFIEFVPKKVRHSLGEYFTPGWLAEHVINSGIEQIGHMDNWFGLDPTCGSGTFLMGMVRCIYRERDGESLSTEEKHELKKEIIGRVCGFDLNPISVLASRVNLYMALQSLSDAPLDARELPVYLADSAIIVESKTIDDTRYSVLTHPVIEGDNISTKKVLMNESIVQKPSAFAELRSKMLTLIRAKQIDQLREIDNGLQKSEEFIGIGNYIGDTLAKNSALAELTLIMLLNQASAHNIPKQHLVVGNLPWVDWRNLPPGYREHIKQLCVDQHLFSGDGRTGGNNLNVCGLLSNVVGRNWMHEKGAMAILMPSNMLFQTSYEGWRNLTVSDSLKMNMQKIISWKRSANPFVGVGQKFNTYIISFDESDYNEGIPFIDMVKKKGTPSWNRLYAKGEGELWTNVEGYFECEESVTGHADERSTRFWIGSESELEKFQKMSGSSAYRSREGLELYPQDVLLWEIIGSVDDKTGLIEVKNNPSERSKIKATHMNRKIEAKFVHPVVRGRYVDRFRLKHEELPDVSPLPYKNGERAPISMGDLVKEAPNLAEFYSWAKEWLLKGTDTTKRTVGAKYATEYYAIGRVGTYTYSENFVVFRDNGAHVACAITGPQETTWGGKRHYICQNHAPYISQTTNGDDITADEAHYITAILNAPIVKRFVESSSDNRSFEVRMLETLRVDRFDSTNKNHKRLVRLSKKAHADPSTDNLAKIDPQLNAAYLKSLHS